MLAISNTTDAVDLRYKMINVDAMYFIFELVDTNEEFNQYKMYHFKPYMGKTEKFI